MEPGEVLGAEALSHRACAGEPTARGTPSPAFPVALAGEEGASSLLSSPGGCRKPPLWVPMSPRVTMWLKMQSGMVRRTRASGAPTVGLVPRSKTHAYAYPAIPFLCLTSLLSKWAVPTDPPQKLLFISQNPPYVSHLLPFWRDASPACCCACPPHVPSPLHVLICHHCS